MGRYLNLEVKPNGLLLTLTPEGREELEEKENHANIFPDLFEDYAANGWTMLQPEQIGALTSSDIIISPDAQTNDDGDINSVDTVYWHERYQIDDPIEKLLGEGLFLLKATP
jgi:hypothetical protein